jgi:hypothetical protein
VTGLSLIAALITQFDAVLYALGPGAIAFGVAAWFERYRR